MKVRGDFKGPSQHRQNNSDNQRYSYNDNLPRVSLSLMFFFGIFSFPPYLRVRVILVSFVLPICIYVLAPHVVISMRNMSD